MTEQEKLLFFFQNLAGLFTHGMRNRLTPAKAAAELLEESRNLTSEKVLASTQLILKSLRGSLDLINALDELWQITPGVPQSKSVNELIGHIAGEQNVAIDTPTPDEQLTLDTKLWQLLLGEIFANIKQHGGGKGKVEWEHNAGRLRLTIQDSGPGLGPMLASRALEATRRSEASTGSGMGLSKASYAALLLGGTLELRASESGVTNVIEANLTSAYSQTQTQETSG